MKCEKSYDSCINTFVMLTEQTYLQIGLITIRLMNKYLAARLGTL